MSLPRFHRHGCALAIGAVLAAGSTLLATSAAGATATPSPAPSVSASASATPAVPAQSDEVSARLAAATARLAQTSAALQQARTAAATAQARTAAAQRAYDGAAAAASEAQAAMTDAESISATAERQAGEARAQRGRLAGEAYRSGGLAGISALANILTADDPADARDQIVAVTRATRFQTLALARADEQAAAAAASLASSGATARRLVAARESASQTLLALQSSQAAEEQAAASLAAAAAVQTQAVTDAQAAGSQDAAQAAAQSAEGARTQTAVGSLGEVHAGPGSLLKPADGPITSPFGMRVHPVTGVYKLHTGTDFGVPCGTPVHAAADGVVWSSGWNTAYGNRLVLTHAALGLATTYNHLTQALVSPGQQVTRGEVIGISGTTGYSTGCHLHVEVIAKGSYVDPELYLTP